MKRPWVSKAARSARASFSKCRLSACAAGGKRLDQPLVDADALRHRRCRDRPAGHADSGRSGWADGPTSAAAHPAHWDRGRESAPASGAAGQLRRQQVDLRLGGAGRARARGTCRSRTAAPSAPLGRSGVTLGAAISAGRRKAAAARRRRSPGRPRRGSRTCRSGTISPMPIVARLISADRDPDTRTSVRPRSGIQPLPFARAASRTAPLRSSSRRDALA